MRLSPSQIDEIVDVLHETIQFYGPAGREDNCGVTDEIHRVLTEAFGPPAGPPAADGEAEPARPARGGGRARG